MDSLLSKTAVPTDTNPRQVFSYKLGNISLNSYSVEHTWANATVPGFGVKFRPALDSYLFLTH